MFSKSKRFVEEVVCGPPVGHYSIVDQKSVKLAGFDKALRWNKDEANHNTEESLENSSSLSNQSIGNKTFNPLFVSSVKKKWPVLPKDYNKHHASDSVCKSLAVDVEFQQAKVNALLEKIKSLELQLKGTQDHSIELERNNEKLHELIGEMRNEKVILVEHNQVLDAEKSNLLKDLDKQADLTSTLEESNKNYVDEIEELNAKLQTSLAMNVDFREQLESVEKMMTDNLRGLSNKYENLEETLENVQVDYKNKLERSNSLIDKIKHANETSKKDLDVMQEVYDNLKLDYNHCRDEMIKLDSESKEKEADLLKKIEDLQEKVTSSYATLEESNKNLNEEKIRCTDLTSKCDETQCHLEKANRETEVKMIECLRLTEELSDLNKNLVTLSKDKERIVKELESSKIEYEILSQQYAEDKDLFGNQISRLKSQNSLFSSDIGKLNVQIKSSKDELAKEKELSVKLKEQLECQLKEFTCVKTTFADKVSRLESDSEKFKKTLSKEKDKFQKAKHDLEQRIEDLNSELELSVEQVNLLKESGADEPLLKELHEELERWKNQYEDLERRVGPFMSQLEQFAYEKETLLNENAFTQSEMSKLSEKYAQILGHQNNKQKIRHIQKLKEENITLKNDVLKLRAEVSRYKRSQLENRDKKHDMAKAFHGKENQVEKQPLKPCNS